MRFSVVTATKDRPEWLPGCLAAVQAQTFKDFEHVVYDVGSRTIKDLLPDDPRVRYVRGKSHGLAPDAKAALSHAKGEVVTLLHDDDRIPPHALETADETIGAAAWLVGKTQFVDPDGKVFRERGGSWDAYEMTRTGTMMLGAAVYWRRSFYKQAGGINTDYDAAWDFEMYVRMSKLAEPVVIPDVLHLYHDHPETESRKRRQAQHEMCLRIRSEVLA